MMDNENNGLHSGTNETPDTGYQNVGSSGTNTANTAENFHAEAQQTEPPRQNENTQNGNTAYDYSKNYTRDPQPQPPEHHNAPRSAKNGGGKKWALRIVAGAACLGVCFGTGYGGAVLAMRNNSANRVVTNMVPRTDSTAVVSNNDFSAVSAKVAPSVVVITTESMVTSNNWFGGQYVQSGAGSGVVLTEDGYIITCNHVVSGANNIKVSLNDGTEYTATLVGGDSTTDVAVLKIDATGLTPATIGDSDSLAVGQSVLAVGNPLGELGGTVTGGMISALNREVTIEDQTMSLIQMDASVSPGNSGGALFNASGDLIGIVNAKSSSSDAEGLGFAIPINTAMEMAKQMIEKGYVARPAMGVTVITINDAQTAMQYGVSNYGVYIYQIASGSGAEKGGLKLGDRIISIDDVAVSSASDVQKYCQSKEVGDTVTLQVERDGKVISCEVTLGESTQSTATAESGN